MLETRQNTMGDVAVEAEKPKKRRKRQHDGRPLSAHLVLDSTVRDDIGRLSEDLWVRLSALGERRHGMVLTGLRREVPVTKVHSSGEPLASLGS